MTAADVLEIVDRLDEGGVGWWIDGGWGVDALLGHERGRQLDFHPLGFDERGDGWQPQLHGPPARWPREAFQARGRIAGREVRCTSPEFQVEAHLYEGYDDVDWAAIVALCERFELPLPSGGPPGFVHERRSVRAASGA
jgi:hypothetical protein